MVTFLLTDIEGSSALWEADPDAMAAALELHDELIAAAARGHGGRLLKTKGEGDSTLTVFRRASDAVAGAVELREALAGASWPGELELRVRIALHTGEAHERDGDYFGPALNRAARLRASRRRRDPALAGHDRDRPRPPAAGHGADRPRPPGAARPVAARAGVRAARDRRGAGATAAGAHETRKTVTVLFAGVVDSTPARGRSTPRHAGGSARATSTTCGTSSSATAGRSRRIRATR